MGPVARLSATSIQNYCYIINGMKKLFVVSVFLLLPTVFFGAYPEVARGAGLPAQAGFAKQSLFLSKSSVTEGDTVLIHAIVSNDTTAKFTGMLVFKDSDITIGSVPVSIIAGEVDTLSVSWKPVAGSHNVRANLEDTNGTVVEQESATFTIAPPPSPKDTGGQANSNASSTIGSSAEIQQTIAQFSPAVAQVVQPIFAAIDSGRMWTANVLDQGINYEKQRLAQKTNGQVLGTQAQKTATTTSTVQDWTNTLWTIINTIALYILSVLRWLVGNAGVFYPALALLFFYFLWRLYKRTRRPR